MRSAGRLASVAAALALLATACSGSGPASAPDTTNPDRGPTVTFVALGGTETSGDRLPDPIRMAWPQLLYRSSLPRRARFVNFSTSRSTVADGVALQLADAVALHPTVATVWFGLSDAFAGTSVRRFGAQLTLIVAGLRHAGAKVVVVLGPGPADGDVDLSPYTDRARAVAAANHATVVDLRTAEVRTEASQQAVADAVARAMGPID